MIEAVSMIYVVDETYPISGGFGLRRVYKTDFGAEDLYRMLSNHSYVYLRTLIVRTYADRPPLDSMERTPKLVPDTRALEWLNNYEQTN